MKVGQMFSHRSTRLSSVMGVVVRMPKDGEVAASIVRDDGRVIDLLMTEEEAWELAYQLSSVKPSSDQGWTPKVGHKESIETENGTASVEYLGGGRYGVADGAAVAIRHSSGSYWHIEGQEGAYPCKLSALSRIMEEL